MFWFGRPPVATVVVRGAMESWRNPRANPGQVQQCHSAQRFFRLRPVHCIVDFDVLQSLCKHLHDHLPHPSSLALARSSEYYTPQRQKIHDTQLRPVVVPFPTLSQPVPHAVPSNPTVCPFRKPNRWLVCNIYNRKCATLSPHKLPLRILPRLILSTGSAGASANPSPSKSASSPSSTGEHALPLTGCAATTPGNGDASEAGRTGIGATTPPVPPFITAPALPGRCGGTAHVPPKTGLPAPLPPTSSVSEQLHIDSPDPTLTCPCPWPAYPGPCICICKCAGTLPYPPPSASPALSDLSLIHI